MKPYSRVTLVRDRLIPRGPRHAEAPGHALVFFHGPGVVQAADQKARKAWLATIEGTSTDLVVCASAWARRIRTGVEAPWRSASLATFWQALADSGPAGARVLVEVASSPADARDRREVLELVLSAGALDLPVDPVFRGAGRVHLDGVDAGAWRQWTDYGFGRLYSLGDADPMLCEIIDAQALEAMRQAAGRVFVI